MQLSFLRALDRRLGLFFLYALALPMRFVAWAAAQFPHPDRQRFIFLKLKGGGSLIVAMPSLIGIRRAHPDAEFILVCTQDAKIYAELTGVFDRYLVIKDSDFLSVLVSGIGALIKSFRAAICVDLEPNSMMACLFTMLSCAAKRIGFVRLHENARAFAYTFAISFDPLAPIYCYYDHICTLLAGTPAAPQLARMRMLGLLPPANIQKPAKKLVGIASFTSDFARERMMPDNVWAELLRQNYHEQPIVLVIFGSPRNRELAVEMEGMLTRALPNAQIGNLAGTAMLAQAAANLALCDEVWAVDSGLLHIARLLGIKTHSFWGPTAPDQRLRPIEGLDEKTHYRKFRCSPCIQLTAPPCGGNNLCMITMTQDDPDLSPPWAMT